MNTLETLQDLLVRDHQLRREQVAPDVALIDLGIDSLALVELMFQVEDRFGIEVPLAPPDELRTLGDVVRYVDGLVARNAVRPRAPPPGAAREEAPPRSPAGT